jgi:RIO kinase 1
MLSRDVNNMTEYYGQYAPELLETKYDKEMWALFEEGKLTPQSHLTGYFEEDTELADVDTVMDEIKAAYAEEQERIERMSDSEGDE